MAERPAKLAEQLSDVEAEHGLIGLLLFWPDAIEEAVTQLDPLDFASPSSQVAFQAIGDLWLADAEVSAISVAKRAAQIDPSFIPGQLIEWMAPRDRIGTASSLVDRLGRLAVNRRLYAQIQEAYKALTLPQADGLEIAAELTLALDQLGGRGDGELELSTAYDVAARPEAEVPWTIPGLLYSEDAVIIVAGEGAGKSVLARQVALCAEAGLHPFTRHPIEPIRTLTIDLENKRRAMTDTFRLALTAIRGTEGRANWQPKGPVWEQPGGMNLLNGRDRRRMQEAIRRTQPDLVFFGPIYKSFRPTGGMKDDAAALEVTNFFDEMRAKFGFGMWIEAHAPFGDGASRDLRPFGTTLWQRWPEYGKNFRHDTKSGHLLVGSFRGDRSRVYWPDRLLVGPDSKGGFPFTGKYERADLQVFGWPQ